ncbi:hypothetical protein BD410DRAFT_1042 [Rickenella mellea]|uniref:DUF6697 domain-containing protein n=1 Tax=Rickenella mellea TaxID=50990 RepID=A0A4R5XDG8_9AGAM|nr:hypothetical protein BD410DRAFT_1042 [Rickenella mellea]
MGTTIYTTQTPDKQSVHVKKAKLTRNEPHMSNKSTPEVVLPYFNRRPTTPRQQPAPVTKRSVILKLPTYVPENIRHEHTKDMERKPNDTTPSMLLATPNDELKLHHNPVPDSDETWLSPLPSTSNAWNPMDSESELSSPPQSPAPSDKDRFELKPAVKKMTPAKSANHKKQPKFSNSGLLADSIRKRLDEYTHNNPVDFEKHKGIINRGLPRKKGLSELFGGSFMGFFHNISNTKRTEHNHQYKRFLCPKIENNCEAPLSVGTPGIIFRIDCDRDDEMLACTVDKIITGVKENEWVYCGDYKKYRSTPLTSEEWSYLNKELRDGWIKLIHEAKEGIKCRARHTVILRHKLKWAPTKQELDEFVEKVKSDEQLGKLSKEEVAKAFEAGHLRIAVWVLQCVKYDVEFATRIAEWVKAANGTSNPDPTPAKQSPSPPSKRKAPVKAKRSVTPDDEKQWENDSYEDSEIEDFEAVRPYHSTGTKSRPAN